MSSWVRETEEDWPLAAFERASQLEYSCSACRDWTTNVTAGKLHPCRECRPSEWLAWKASQIPGAGARVAVMPTGQFATVVLPSSVGYEGDSPIQPCQPVPGEPCRGVVLVKYESDGKVAWVNLDEIEIVNAP